MASEHAGHVAGQQYHDMELLSEVDTELEAFLSRELGTSVVLPPSDLPPRKGAHLGEREGLRMGVVGCFCQRRGKAVTVFVMSSRGVDTSGLVRSELRGTAIFHGASGSCHVAIWAQGDLFYALAGELEADDLLDMAARASVALTRKLQG
jgi:anti-sigma factor RsiW